jgi:hypothetical protein
MQEHASSVSTPIKAYWIPAFARLRTNDESGGALHLFNSVLKPGQILYRHLRLLLPLAVFGRAARCGNVARAIDQSDVREGLREVADQALRDRVVLF